MAGCKSSMNSKHLDFFTVKSSEAAEDDIITRSSGGLNVEMEGVSGSSVNVVTNQ